MEFTFELDETDQQYIVLAENFENYEDLAQQPDRVPLAAWQLQKLWIELSQITRNVRSMNDAPILNRYFPESLADGAAAPKFLLLSGHSTNMGPYRDLLGAYDIITMVPGASLWVEFYVCDDCPEEDPQKYRNIGYFCNDPNDFSECEPMIWSSNVQREDGSATNVDFELWLQGNLDTFVESLGEDSYVFEELCDIDFVHNEELNPYPSTTQFFIDLLVAAGLRQSGT